MPRSFALRDQRFAIIRSMMDEGHTRAEILDALKVERASIERYCYHHGETELGNYFRRQDESTLPRCRVCKRRPVYLDGCCDSCRVAIPVLIAVELVRYPDGRGHLSAWPIGKGTRGHVARLSPLSPYDAASEKSLWPRRTYRQTVSEAPRNTGVLPRVGTWIS